jgi:hypothetical protein
MKYEAIINEFKGIVDSYCGHLQFMYERVWAMNGSPSIDPPVLLVECQPDFDLVGFQHKSSRPAKQVFRGKLFFFDTFWESEQSAKELWVKQSELNELAMQYIGKCREVFTDKQVEITFGSGFFGKDVHNAKLIEVFVPFIVTIQADCTELDTTSCLTP